MGKAARLKREKRWQEMKEVLDKSYSKAHTQKAMEFLAFLRQMEPVADNFSGGIHGFISHNPKRVRSDIRLDIDRILHRLGSKVHLSFIAPDQEFLDAIEKEQSQ